MDYLEICRVYGRLERTTKGLEKAEILASFLGEIRDEPELIYLLQGRLFADYDNRELGVSHQLVIRAIGRAAGISDVEVVKKFKKFGDLGKVAEAVLGEEKKQMALFSKKLSVEKVMENLRKLPTMEGAGAVEQKVGHIVELLHSASPEEAKYIVRTVLSDLKIGVGSGILRDAIVVHCFKPKDLEDKKVCVQAVQEAYDKATDFAEVFEMACSDSLEKIKLEPGKPVRVMLFPKAKDVDDAFRIVGRPAAFEYKYDGFRVMINKEGPQLDSQGHQTGQGGKIKIFTRRLEEVTKQFPEIVEYVRDYVKGASFILDAEAVGFGAETKKYTDFQAISQRIRRKYDIGKLRDELPIELVVFDVIYYDGESLIEKPFRERRKLIERIVSEEEWKIILAKQIVTEDAEEVEKFYEAALADNQEGLMGKNLNAPYKPGARIGHAVKLKPVDRDFDLVITGAEWGTGKRAGWLTSFDISCRNSSVVGGRWSVVGDLGNEDELLQIGKVSTGLKELRDEGLSFAEMTDMLEKLVVDVDGKHVKVKPEIVVSVQYQNVQKSPTYSSGFALRFPRILRLRADRGVDDVATLDEVAEEASS
ncbi:MAG: ATP-dependent DNA ligase [Nanoarchaeota archaeon]|nr:ATP-dependent DNA ligase [Nanoarchaeota archaeon]